VAAFFGDVNDTGIPFPSNGAVGAIAVVASLNPSTVFQTLPGFALFPCLDPVIIGGVAETGQRDIVSNDNTVMNNQLTLGQTQIPWLPAGLSVTPVGPDPTLSVPTNLVASPGGTVIVPVNIDTARPEGIGMVEGVLALTYDPKVFDVSAADVQLGTVPGAGGGWQLKTEVNAQTGLIGVELYSSTAIQSSVGGSLVTIAMHVRQTAPVGTTGLTLVPYVDPTGGAGVYETSLLGAGGEFILHPAATSAGLEPGVPGLVTIAAQAPVAGGLMMVSQAAAAVSVPAVPSSFDVQAASRAASSALALAVVEEVFAGLAETAQWVQETALVQPGVILTSESNDQGTTTRVRDLALSVSNLAPGESPGANYNTAEWLPGDWLASLGQTSRRGLLASAADPVDGAAEDADQAGLEAYFAREAGAFRLP